MMRGHKWMGVVGLALLAGFGCSHSHPRPQAPRVTGSAEALAVVAQLKGVNDPPPVIFGTFVYEATQPRGARWAELCCAGASEQDIAQAKAGPAEYLEVYRFERKPEGKGFRDSRSWKADGRDYSPPEIRCFMFMYDMRMGGAADPRLFSCRMRFPAFYGQVSVRKEVYNGETCVVLHDEGPSLFWEYYLSEKDGWVPRRIIQRQKLPAGTTRPVPLPQEDQTMAVETETGRWPFRTRQITRWTVPAAAFKELDLNWTELDSDTVVKSWVKRPDGKWFITESTTTYPLFRRTEHFRVENLSFDPGPHSD